MEIVKIPLINGLSKTKGCEKTPDLLIENLNKIYTNEKGNQINSNNLRISEINFDDLNIIESTKKVYSAVFNLFKKQGKFVFLGGDHSMSYPTAQAFLDSCENLGKQPCLIVFDAHPDLMQPVDKEIPTHEEWLRNLIEQGFPAENILLVGVRNSWKNEIEFIKQKKIKTISINSFLEDIHDSCDTIMEFANNKELYVSIDIDVVDPVFAPGIYYKEIGGFTSRQFLYLIQRINKMKNLKVVDIVEINSKLDKDDLTIKLGAKILSEFL